MRTRSSASFSAINDWVSFCIEGIGYGLHTSLCAIELWLAKCDEILPVHSSWVHSHQAKMLQMCGCASGPSRIASFPAMHFVIETPFPAVSTLEPPADIASEKTLNAPRESGAKKQIARKAMFTQRLSVIYE